MTWIPICVLTVGVLVAGWIGWRSADRDTATDARVKVLEGELDAMRKVVATTRAVHLRRVETCADCVFCNASPESFADIHHEPGAAP
jgi:hypothetical protein